jgi:hypothetical protein
MEVYYKGIKSNINSESLSSLKITICFWSSDRTSACVEKKVKMTAFDLLNCCPENVPSTADWLE